MLGRLSALSLGVALAVSVGGCLGRTGLIVDDSFEDAAAALDSSTSDDTSVTTEDTGVVAKDSNVPPEDTAPIKDTGINIFDVFPIPDSGPIGVCAQCVANNCGNQVNACVNDRACLQGLACTVTQCLLGGGGGGGGGGGSGGGGGGFSRGRRD